MADGDGGWDWFVAALGASGLIADGVPVRQDDEVDTWDSFQRARLWLLLRQVRPQLTDECLRSIRTVGDAFGWIDETAAVDADRRPCRLEPVTSRHYAQIYEAATLPAQRAPVAVSGRNTGTG